MRVWRAFFGNYMREGNQDPTPLQWVVFVVCFFVITVGIATIIPSSRKTKSVPKTNGQNNVLEFDGNTCKSDCSGHEAGYNWAKEHGITQDGVDGYSGNSSSFKEGMQSYVDDKESDSVYR